MRAHAWLGGFFVALLLVCICLGLAQGRRCETLRRCPRTKAEAHLSQTIKYGGRCYEVFTCSQACGKSLAKLVEASASAFAEKYGAERREVMGESGLHVCHHITKEPVQFAREVAC
jgi:hypothetical protein